MIQIQSEEASAAAFLRGAGDAEKIEQLCTDINNVVVQHGLSLGQSSFALMSVISRSVAESGMLEEKVVESAKLWSGALSCLIKTTWNVVTFPRAMN